MVHRTRGRSSLRRMGSEPEVGRIRAGWAGLVQWWCGEDKGTGTSMGLALMSLVALGLILVALIGNLLICRSRARTGADASALAAAAALMEESGPPCDQAAILAIANQGRMTSCKVEGEDVIVEVSVSTGLAWIPEVTQVARAGPRECL